MKGFLLLTANVFSPIVDIFKNRSKKKDDFDVMSDVDDQRAHHFGGPEELDDSA